MGDAFLAYMILWAAILAYFLLASIDFGTGFYHLMSWRHPPGEGVREAIRSYVNPRWEVTNVFLVLIVVSAAAFFPGLVSVLGTVLLLPVSLVAVLFILRGAFLVFDFYGGERRLFATTYSLAGLLILPLLSVVLTLIISNPVTVQNGAPSFDILSPLSNPVTYVTAFLVFAGQILLSGVLAMAYDESPEDREVYRNPVYASMGTVAALGIAELILLRANAGYAFDKMLELAPVMVFAGLLFVLAGFLVWRGTRRLALYAFLLLAAVDSIALLTFALAHFPYLIYPDITAGQMLAAPEMLTVLTPTLILGLLVVGPALLYLNYLFRSEKSY
ncbi:MAG TPA: cytochrome d ubiquinol oxidase subunit II [Thermoplasmata archaeon]|nr:cytochrome d ubiquinol oxidase subunit II [Thermoplasmata archaeon]